MINFWNNQKVLVTGGTGFIGSHVVELLIKKNAKVTVLDRIKNNTIKNIGYLKDQINFINGDCTDLNTAKRACQGKNIVMNLAAHVGGIEYNRMHQATMLRDNLNIGMTMLEAARVEKVNRFLVVSSACVYPRDAIIPTPEEEGFRSEPEPTNGGYGWGKRMAEKLGVYYAEEFGMNISIIRPYNAYGPRDHFDSYSSHVIPALIKRVLSDENPVVVWGSGNQTRAFLYVEDLASGMLKAIEKYPKSDPVNIGTDEEISIKELINKIVRYTGKNPKILFDKTKPDGSPRRNSDNSKAKRVLEFKAKTKFDTGLRKTIDWYINTYKS